jgi:anti-sigma regulatory factor (Ser/Thr protein kinase)
VVTVALPDTWVYALRLPHDPRAARVARMTVRAALNGHGMSEVLDVAVLLTSELVTNAYQYANGAASLRLTALGGGRLRVSVWDANPYVPAPFDAPPGVRPSSAPVDAINGRGLLLVQAWADAWGGDALGRGAGKLLWFEVGGRAREAWAV